MLASKSSLRLPNSDGVMTVVESTPELPTALADADSDADVIWLLSSSLGGITWAAVVGYVSIPRENPLLWPAEEPVLSYDGDPSF